MKRNAAAHLRPVTDGPQWWKVDSSGEAEPATPGPATPQAPRPATATGPEPVDEHEPRPVPGAALEVAAPRPVSLSQNAAALVQHWAASSQRSGGLLDGMLGDPPSVRRHIARIKAREWVPEGHPGGFIGPAGAVHGWTIGLLLVAVGAYLQWLGHKAIRFYLTVLFAGIAVLFLYVFVFG